MTSRSLTPEQRDVLYAEISAQLTLGSLDDVRNFLKLGLGEQIVGTARRCRDLMRLLDDIGWNRDDPRPSYDLTMSEEELERIFGRLRGDMEGWLADLLPLPGRAEYFGPVPSTDEEWAKTVEQNRESVDYALDVQRVCALVLETAGARPS